MIPNKNTHINVECKIKLKNKKRMKEKFEKPTTYIAFGKRITKESIDHKIENAI